MQKEKKELSEFIKVQQQRIEELSITTSNLAKQIENIYQSLPTTAIHHTKSVKKRLNFVDNSSKKNFINQSSTTTELSTSMLESDNQTEDDMVKEAQSRLKILEINTAKVEKNLKSFHANRAKNMHISQVDRKPYNDICSHFSDDSDFGITRNSQCRINLKELANKISYHRSIRQSRNTSPSGNDTSPETFRNLKFQDRKNITNVSPIKTSQSEKNYVCEELSLKKLDSTVISSLGGSNNCYNEPPQNVTTQSQVESIMPSSNLSKFNNFVNKTQSETVVDTDTNNHLTSLKKCDNGIKTNYLPINDDTIKNTTIPVVHNNLSDNDISLENKKELESNHTVSFGSSRTDKSSDFWA